MTTLHPSAWIAWLTAICVFAFVVTNPLYMVLALAAVIVVHLSFRADASPVGRAVRVFLIVGVVLLVIRILFIGLLPNPGRTTLVVLPQIHTPRWLGGFELGGPLRAEVLVEAASEGLRLIVVLAAFGVLNARADLAGVLRTVPPVFRDVGLVVSIAVAFVPGVMRTLRDVRDAQRLRGENGLRRLAPTLVVPVLGLSLERALLLAESMDVRGYGRSGSAPASRTWLTTGTTLLLVSMAAWVAGFQQIAIALTAAGAAMVVWGFRQASVRSVTTRLQQRRVTAFDLVVIVASTLAVVGTILASARASYDPYPVVAWPPFAWRVAALTMLFAVPALAAGDAR